MREYQSERPHIQHQHSTVDIWYLLGSYFLGSIPSFMLPTLITLLMVQRGIEPTLIGVYGATQFVAILAAIPVVERITGWFGSRHTYVLATVITLGIAVGFMLTTSLVAWFIFNAVWGFLGGIRWIVGESWVAELAPQEQRGRFIGVFETMVGAATFVGPSLLLITGTSDRTPFLIAAGFLFLALVCLLRMRSPQGSHAIEHNVEQRGNGFAPILKAIPTVLLASFIGGIFESGTTVTLPVYGISVGLNTLLAASLVTAIGVGSFLLQYPLGHLADRVNILHVFVGSVTIMLLSSLVLPLASVVEPLLWALGFVWGGLGGGLYTLAMIHIGMVFNGAHLVRATALLVFIYTLGSAIGPAAGGVALDLSPRYGLSILFASIGAVGLVMMLIALRNTTHQGET